MNINIDEAIKIMKSNVKDPIAQGYLSVLDECIELDGTYGLAFQLNYVMCNVSSWKGKQAKEIKKVIRKWIKEKLNNVKYNSIAAR
jgi:hypothetical protein